MSTFKNIGESSQKVWEVIRKQTPITIPTLQKSTKLEARTLAEILGRMVAVNLVEVDRTTKPHIYKIKTDVGHHLPKFDTKGERKAPSYQDKVWMAIKPLKVFRLKDVTLCAETPLNATRVYFHYLHKAGYISIVGKDSSSAIYSFNKKMDTGLKSPSVVNKSVYDRNLRKIVWEHPTTKTNEEVA